MAAQTHTDRLERLRLSEVAERARARDADLAATSAKADADRARERLVEAHAEGAARGVGVAEKAHTVARDHVEDATIKSEAAQLRAQRTGHARQAYEAENARALIAELQPAGSEVAARLERSAQELIAANAEWQAIAQRVSELLAAMPGATPAADGPRPHVLESVIRDVRRALDLGDVASPLPHLEGGPDED